MGNAIWLLLALPQWYFSSILNPFSAGPLSAVPALGTICVFVGILLGFIRGEGQLLLFLVPFALSEVLVGIAGAFRGQPFEVWNQPLLYVFLGVQLMICGYLIYRLIGARLEASILSFFCMTYALFAAFIATMAFSDTWL